MFRIARHCLVVVIPLVAIASPIVAQAHDHRLASLPAAPVASTTVDSAQRRVVVSVRALNIPAATPYDHHVASTPIDLQWPVSGWIRGYRVGLVDASGRPLPQTMLHHAGVVNADRRQLTSPAAERLLAASRETGAVLLPASMGVPLEKGTHLVLYFALVNPTDSAVIGATLRLEIDWTPARAGGPREVLPILIDAAPALGEESTFDAPPGISITSSEFTLPLGGYLRALGGHLHDYGVELRLEDVQSGRVLARLKSIRTASGHVTGVSRTKFAFKRRGLRLDAGRPYRIVAVYDNPTMTKSTGAMAGFAGLFTPDDMRQWPALDATNPEFRADYAWLLGQSVPGNRARHNHD